MILFSCAEVKGNGTVIKNLVSSFGIVIPDGATSYIHDISFLNAMYTAGVPADGYGEIYVGWGTAATLERFTFSSLAASSVPYVINNSVGGSGTLSMKFCAFNCELPSASANFCTGHIPISAEACRFTLSLPNSTASLGVCHPGGTAKSCEIVMNAPSATAFYGVYLNQSTLRGSLKNITQLPDDAIQGLTATDSIVCLNDLDSQKSAPTTLIGVTDTQMKEAFAVPQR